MTNPMPARGAPGRPIERVWPLVSGVGETLHVHQASLTSVWVERLLRRSCQVPIDGYRVGSTSNVSPGRLS
jgi:hypothetical protein